MEVTHFLIVLTEILYEPADKEQAFSDTDKVILKLVDSGN